MNEKMKRHHMRIVFAIDVRRYINTGMLKGKNIQGDSDIEI